MSSLIPKPAIFENSQIYTIYMLLNRFSRPECNGEDIFCEKYTV